MTVGAAMTEPRDDADFEAYLEGNSPVSHRYAQLASEEPPPALDAEILEAARQAVHPDVVPLKKSPRRWMMPATVAATIVLSFSLVMSIVFDPSVMMNDGDVTIATALKKDEMSQSEAPAETVMAEAPRLKVQSVPVAPATGPAPAPVLSDEVVQEPARMARETEANGLDGRAADMAAVGASAVDATAALRDTTKLLAALRALAPRADQEQLAAAEESRLRRENGTFAALQSKSLPEETDTVEDAFAPGAEEDLEQILAMFEADEEQAALEALASFSQARPEHPASQIYFEWSGDTE